MTDLGVENSESTAVLEKQEVPQLLSKRELYTVDVGSLPDNVLINTCDKPYWLPNFRKKAGNTHIKFLKGDRIQGDDYREMVEAHPMPGICQANQLADQIDYVIELNKARARRNKKVLTPYEEEAISKRKDDVVIKQQTEEEFEEEQEIVAEEARKKVTKKPPAKRGRRTRSTKQ